MISIVEIRRSNGKIGGFMKICGFCEYYQCVKEDLKGKLKEDCLVEIGVKVCTCRKRKGMNKSSSLVSRMFRLEYCPVCGKRLGELYEPKIG